MLYILINQMLKSSHQFNSASVQYNYDILYIKTSLIRQQLEADNNNRFVRARGISKTNLHRLFPSS